jgi:aspartate-semialdehyde dehydrogenase
MLRSSGSRGYRVGIVNPTTLVGKEIAQILRERGFSAEEVRMIDTSGADEGLLAEGIDEPVVVRPAGDDAFEGLDIVFFCGPAEESEEWVGRRDELGFVAIDLCQPSLSRPAGRDTVAGVNSESIAAESSLLISPHPIATATALVLAPIIENWTLDLCVVTAVEPASEHDQKGIDEMFAQTVAVLNVKGVPREVFGRQAAFSLYPPASDGDTADYATRQLHAILGDQVPVSVGVLQGSTFHSHSLSMFIRIAEEVLEEELVARLQASEGLSVAESDDPVGTVDAGGRDEVLIGRVRQDSSLEGAFWIFLVADNLRRSSALNAVLIAEHIVERFGTAAN